MSIKYAGKQWISSGKTFNITRPCFTLEVFLKITENAPTDCPTMICKMAEGKMSRPIYRLGLYRDTNKPEFQLLLHGKELPESVVADTPIRCNKITHIGATYDGECIILYVDGKEVKRVLRTGVIASSSQDLCFGAKVKDGLEEGFFIGSLYGIRLFTCVRTSEAIEYWSNKYMPSPKEKDSMLLDFYPQEEDLKGLWSS